MEKASLGPVEGPTHTSQGHVDVPMVSVLPFPYLPHKFLSTKILSCLAHLSHDRLSYHGLC